MAEPFLSTTIGNKQDLCLICCQIIKKNEKSQTIGEQGLERFKVLADQWSKVDIPLQDERHRYTDVHDKLISSRSNNTILKVHTKCHLQFRTNIERCVTKYGLKAEPQPSEEDKTFESEYESLKKRATRSTTDLLSSKEICFVCNVKRVVDDNSYHEGGLARCSTKNAADRLIERKETFLKDKACRFFVAARRLNILLSGQTHDIFAADIYYHQSCYIKFAFSPFTKQEKEVDENKKVNDVLNIFLYRLKKKIIRDKHAYFLSELLKDIEILSDDEGLESPAFSNTRSLKRYITDNLGEEISFFPTGKYLLVHAIDVNPCEYSLATLHGCGLRDDDLAKSFGRMIRRKLKMKTQEKPEWPLSPEELICKLDEGPLPDLYNAIYYSMYDNMKKNEHGYAVTSRTKATKIWSIASDWETLVTNSPSPKLAVMGLVLHRITGKNRRICCFGLYQSI